MDVLVGAGPRRELEQGKTGVAQVLERLLALPARDGLKSSHATADDYTSFELTFAKRELEPVLASQAQRFLSLAWTDSAYRREARAIEAEYKRMRATPVFRVFETQREIAFTAHPYRHARYGSRRDVAALQEQSAAARAFFDRWYRPENTTIVVAGDVDPANVIALIEQDWGAWAKGSYVAEVPREPESNAAATSHIRWETPASAWVTVAFRSPGFSADDRNFAALEAAMEVWFGPHSALYRRLVVDEAKVDQFGIDVMANEDPGLATVYARVRNTKDFLYVRDRILDTAARAREEEVPAERFEGVQSNAHYELASSLDDPSAIAAALARYARFRTGGETLDRYACTRGSVTAADVHVAAQRYFTDEGLVVVTLANERRPVEMEKLQPLATFGAVNQPASAAPATEVPVIVERTDSARIGIKLQFAAGSGRDPVGRDGLARLAASMIIRGGSSAMPVEDARAALFAIAGSIDVEVDKELTTFTLSAPRDEWSRLLDLTLPMLLAPALPRDVFLTEKTSQQDELQKLLADDLLAGTELLQQLSYRGLPYGHPALGSVDGIDTTTLSNVRDFIRQHYTTGNLTVGVVGEPSPALLARLRSELRALPGGKDAPLPTTKRLPTALAVEVYDKESTVSSITLGQAVDVDRSHPDWAALTIAGLVLGDPASPKSRLQERISDARKLNDGAFAFLAPAPGPPERLDDPLRARRGSVFEIALRPVAPKHTAMAVRIAVYEFRRLIEQGITDEELERARAALLASLELEGSDERRLEEALAARSLNVPASRVEEQVRTLTRADVNRAIREHLQPKKIHVVVVAPEARERRVELLRKTPAIAYASEPSKALVAEDAAIAAMDVELEPEDVRLYPITDAFIE